ncbi:CRAL/TRIO domain-containing protein [Tieghemostelium lacteum]|uniref:CRAL/TRIO domain-containing protein n=1 Tax=Tieghemostelium lacteum TaxID=361077 RepID=A0A151ZGL8_TIELA|nr:CRAL/TRIO domain-containing protein [Tieghemostelium lacteum]|eukprot:KYQ93113.1 CRAL/TRIO domain-containing protein [Tieghemostelium lacteum]
MDYISNNETPSGYGILKNLTQEELTALQAFKSHPSGVTNGIEDQYLMIYLFSKKLDVERAVVLLTNNLAFRKKYNVPFPVRKRDVNPELAKKASNYAATGHKDTLNRAISYLTPSKLVPKDYPLEEYITHLFWNIDQTCHESAVCHRNGLVIVEDLKDISIFKHVDSRMKLDSGKSMSDIFPGRIAAIYLLHTPIYIRPLLAFAKTFVKSKLIKRVHVVKSKELLFEYFEKHQIITEFGGSMEFHYADYFDKLPSDY